ncbi:FAD binding domain-containing protein [Aeromicrobium sp. YIM 150415]|uniref:FAD binding domain-containing protein n=1 Tax=Aeromicrobium sp. YIM 150415 TaxID=2803912 RepID=UPI001963003F|nr:FAD binding domain-containing protein [Aeromicrobium sp. YIM 150415]MBM9465013.1 FAD binding domain-containing protein [Aeromicrobium sp. YIM 150415]
MKAAPFSYVRPTSPKGVLTEMSLAPGEAKIIAGGQSLMPVLAMRLGRPPTLVDISRVSAWQSIEIGAHEVRIGAAVRQRAVERHGNLRIPLLSRALPWIGHREIRSRGTVCGSLAHADPASELPAVMVTLGARLGITGPGGDRELPADDFFRGAMTTALEPGEVLRHVTVPRTHRGQGFGFAEMARRHGDFALVGVTTMVQTEGDQVVRALLGAFGVADRPRLLDVTETVAGPLRSATDAGGAADVAEALADAARELVTTGGDKHASAGYRRRLVRVLGGRELVAAFHDSRKGESR